MPQATIPFDDHEMTLEATEVYALAAAQDVLYRIQAQIGELDLYPQTFLENLDGALGLLSFLVEQTVPQLRQQ